MKYNKQKLFLIILIITGLVTSIPSSCASSNNQTHSLDTSIYHFKLDNSCRLKFDVDLIYFGDSNGLWVWINNNAIKFYNAKMNDGDSTTFTLLLTNTNLTITKLFEDKTFKATVSPSGGDINLQLSEVEKPSQVLKDSTRWDWNYNRNSQTLSIDLPDSTEEITIIWGSVSHGFVIGLCALIAGGMIFIGIFLFTSKRKRR